MNTIRPKESTLETMQERLAELQRQFVRRAQESQQELMRLEHDMLVLQGQISEEVRRPFAAKGAPMPPAPRYTSSTLLPSPDDDEGEGDAPLQTEAPVPSLAVVAPAAATQTKRKVKRIYADPKYPHRPIESTHPFPNAVGNVKGWCQKHGAPYAAAKSWYSNGASWNPIPRRWAELLARDYGVPIKAWKGRHVDKIVDGKVVQVWRDGITDDPRAGKAHRNRYA